jgi:enediyne biosynthesis protein E4
MPISRSISRSLIHLVGLCALSSTSFAQQAPDSQSAKPQEGGQPPASGGVNTGGVHAPVLDNERRPITAGGFVQTGPIVFEDIAAKAGLTTWKHTMGTPEKHFIIETNGSGVGLIDYDNDGWLDIYLVNGSTADALAGKAPAPKAALFHNNHDGTFTDVAGA